MKLIAVAVAALLAVPGVAGATPKPKTSCRLVPDATGDTNSPIADAALDAQLDITSADVATNTRSLTVVLRLASLAKSDPANPQGRVYEFDFTAREKNFILMGSLLPGGNTFGVYISDSRFEEGQSGARAATGIGDATGVVDTAHKEVRITAPLEVFSPYAKLSKNVVLYYLTAFTYRANGLSAQGSGDVQYPVQVTGSLGVGVDEAWGHKAYYQAGYPSCVRVGS